MNNFGEKIRKIRKDRGLTQQEFADSLGYAHKSTINKIESGQEDMSYQKILILLKEYMLSAKDLFDDINKEIEKTDKLTTESPIKHDSCVVYIHGLFGNAKEAEFYSFLSNKYDVIGLDYKDGNPWEVKNQVISEFTKISARYKKIYVIANSMGVFYAYRYLSSFKIEKAFFISPFVNMKTYIEFQMHKHSISRKQFEESKIIELPDKQVISYDFYQSLLIKDNWKTKTYILYGEKDKVVDKDNVFNFASNHDVCLTIMKNGEHYFHTSSQLKFVKRWMSEYLK